ncbi:MAG: hypothetical protein GY868_16510, partial [Deltaproteobacteria bacterium]|nr:hypothetical protein [Deltaproteobacteria bacterium]
RADGPIIQLVAVNIDPEVQERQLGDRLLEFMLQRCSVMPGISAVVGVTLCRDYHKQKEMPMEKYIHKRDDHGQLSDPVLRFHERHGAMVTELVARYRLRDRNNEGFGVVVRYDIHNRKRREAKVNIKKTLPGKAFSEEVVEEFLEDMIKKLLGGDKEESFSKERPLMEMGLDSASLLKLSEQMSLKFQKELEPAFFFQYNTPQRVISYFREQMAMPEEQKAGLPKPGSKTSQISVKRKKDVPGYPLDAKDNGIAVIGMSCRLPGGINSPQDLWDFLKKGKSAIGRMPEGRWSWPVDIDPQHAHPGIDRGGFLKDMACFDAAFFRLSPKEVEVMDPQQRILLELAWEALEDCGYSA